MAKLSDGFIEEIKDRIEKVRKAIKIEDTVAALQACVSGEKMLDREQIAAAKILLAKVLPDLKAIEHTGEIGHRNVNQLTDAELEAIASGGSERAAPPSDGNQGPTGVH